MISVEDRHSPYALPVLETFYSIQGEGLNTGKAAYFIRIGGCDMGCRWCDSKEAWNWEPEFWTTVAALVARIVESKANSVVVTGGEPLLYDLGLLTQQCHKHNLKLYLETCGVHKLTGTWDWICLSPKPQKEPLAEFYSLASELKVIIYDKPEDFVWAEKMAARVNKDCALLLQPEWSRFNETKRWVVDYVKRYPQWRVSVQTHKYLQIP
ncbi:MAG: 7-carboxy-7-deazaguanine synthase QueE [Bacteroidales bacterium]